MHGLRWLEKKYQGRKGREDGEGSVFLRRRTRHERRGFGEVRLSEIHDSFTSSF